jgi:uncharacterized Zn finger protein
VAVQSFDCEGNTMRADVRTCPCCHTDEYEVVRSETHGYVALCCECGYAREATLEHLLAS